MLYSQMLLLRCLVAGLFVVVLQLCFDLYILCRVRRLRRPIAPRPVATDEYRVRFLQTSAPQSKRRALYVSETTYLRYMAAARAVQGPEASLVRLTDAILCDHLTRYEAQIAALGEKTSRCRQ